MVGAGAVVGVVAGPMEGEGCCAGEFEANGGVVSETGAVLLLRLGL